MEKNQNLPIWVLPVAGIFFAGLLLVYSLLVREPTGDDFTNEFGDNLAINYDDLALQNLESGQAFLKSNGKKPGIVTLPSGLQYEIVAPGDGPKPEATDKVKTHYRGTLIDGTEFDSSHQRNEPSVFPVNGVIAGWTEALQLMQVGAKWNLYVPSDLAYKEIGAGNAIGPNETLIFEIELLGIE